MIVVQLLLLIVAGYLVLGFLFAIPFVWKGAKAIDEGADPGTWGFRLIIFPGCMVFWPVLFRKWIKAKSESHDKSTA